MNQTIKQFFIRDPTERVATRPLIWRSGTNACYYTHDGNKNVSEVVDGRGETAAHYEYAPFGAVTAARGIFAAANPWRFSSEYAEDATGTVYYNYRHYELGVGRWMQRDRIFEASCFSLYNMIGNNAIMGIDYRGDNAGIVAMIATAVLTMIAVRTSLSPSGLKTEYAYDAEGREQSIRRSGPDMMTEVTTYSYTSVDPADIVPPVDTRPRTIVRKHNGIGIGTLFVCWIAAFVASLFTKSSRARILLSQLCWATVFATIIYALLPWEAIDCAAGFALK